VLNDRSIDPESRAIIRYALETNDPWLAELVRRADSGETTDQLDFSQTPDSNDDDSTEAKIEGCVELICRASGNAAIGLLVLMATLEKAAHPKALANIAKHLVFTCCAESNLNGMVDAQVSALERELLRELYAAGTPHRPPDLNPQPSNVWWPSLTTSCAIMAANEAFTRRYKQHRSRNRGV